MCSCEKVDYLVIDNSVDSISAVSATDFTINITQLNREYDYCSLELVGVCVDDTDPANSPSTQIRGFVKVLMNNVNPMNVFDKSNQMVGAFSRRFEETDMLIDTVYPIKTHLKVLNGSYNIKICDVDDVIHSATNISSITLIFKITYHEKSQKLL